MTEPFVAYLLAYFLDEGTPDGEQVRFALSRGADPVSWQVLNDGRPILCSDVGERGVRDPFLVRDERSGKHFLLATDLRTWPDHDWNRAVRHGSRSIVVWESDDLVHWSDARHLEIAPEDAGNAWAPKAFWSAERNEWLVFYAAALYSDDDGPDHERPDDDRPGAGRDGRSYQRMLFAPTSDFRSFGPSEIYLDPGHDVIDATFIEHSGSWYRFSANARTSERNADIGHHIFEERGTSLLDPDYVPLASDIGRDVMARGEGPAVATALDGRSWFLLIDEFGMRGYQLFTTDDLSTGRWRWREEATLPTGARHGSIIPVTAAEVDTLMDAHARSSSCE